MAIARDPIHFPVRQLVAIPLAVAVYAVILHWVYSDILVPSFGYMGYKYVPPSHFGITALIWLVTVICAWFLPGRIKHPSSLILWILFTVMLAPSLLLSPYLGALSEGRVIGVSFGLGLAFIAICLGVRRSKPLTGLMPHPSATSFWIAIGVFSAFVYVYMAATAGLSFNFVAILDVYDVRSEYVDELETAGLLGYLVSTQANVVNPIIIARGIYSKRWGLVILGTLGQLVLYSGTGFKTILFSVAAIVILALIFRQNLRPRGSLLLWGASGLALFAAAMDAWQDGILWTSLFARRFLITPGRLSNLYFEFYSDRPPHMLAESILGPWVDNEYMRGPARTISIWVTGSDQTSMNANFLANGFSQFHWAGVFGAALILIIYLRVLDRASYGIPAAVSALVVVMPAVALSNTAIYTAMLSHGLVIAVVFLALAPRGGWGSKTPKDRGKFYYTQNGPVRSGPRPARR